MNKKTSMFELLNERLTEEEIIKLTVSYDNKFNELEEENKKLKNQLQQKGNIIKEVREYIKNNKLYNEEYYTHNGDKYIKSVDDFSSRQHILYLLDKGE